MDDGDDDNQETEKASLPMGTTEEYAQRKEEEEKKRRDFAIETKFFAYFLLFCRPFPFSGLKMQSNQLYERNAN